MITLDRLITMFGIALNGSDVVMDVRGKYHPMLLKAILGQVHADIVNTDPSVASDMALNYEIPLTLSGGVYKGKMPKKTVGSKGIFAIRSGSEYYSITTREEFRQLSTISDQRICELVGADTLVFSKKPDGYPNAVVTTVPAFLEMDGDEVVMLAGQEVKLFKVAFDMIRRDQLIQDKLNNSAANGGASQ